MAENDYGIVVGIRTYPAMRSLAGPCLDAREFYDWLIDPNGGDVPNNQVGLVITDDFNDPDSTDHPWADEVHSLFKDFVSQGYLAHKTGPSLGRRLYIYMAGHGFSGAGQMTEAALFAANATPAVALNVAATRYAEWFRYNAVFDEIVLVMDCCRTTSLVSEITAPTLPNTKGSPVRGKVRYFYAYAVSDGEAAREQPTNGTVRGIFTTALLEAMRNAQGDPTGKVRGQDIADYVHSTIGEIQAPDFDVKKRSDVVLLQSRAAGLFDTPLRLTSYDGGEKVIVSDGFGQPIDTIEPEGAEFQVKLRPGLYKVRVDGTDRKDLFEVPVEEPIVI